MSIGFKEWALVCDALGRGEQSLILRKGGVAEGRDGFSFKHPEFFLVPTLFHEQVEKLKLPSHTKLPEHEPGIIRIQYLARQEWTSTISDWQIARALDAFHVWREEVIAERFQYDSAKCLHVAFVRIFQLDQPWTFPEQPAYFGCRSWISLPEPPKIALAPVLADSVHRELAERVQHLLSDGHTFRRIALAESRSATEAPALPHPNRGTIQRNGAGDSKTNPRPRCIDQASG